MKQQQPFNDNLNNQTTRLLTIFLEINIHGKVLSFLYVTFYNIETWVEPKVTHACTFRHTKCISEKKAEAEQLIMNEIAKYFDNVAEALEKKTFRLEANNEEGRTVMRM